MMAAVVMTGGVAERALGDRYSIGNRLMTDEMSYNSLVYKATYGGIGVLAALLIVAGVVVYSRTDPPRSKVEGRAENVKATPTTVSKYNSATRQYDTRTVTEYTFDVVYSVGGTEHRVQGLRRSAPVNNQDSVILEYDNADPAHAWTCCKMSSGASGAIILSLGGLCGLVAGAIYAFRNNSYVVNRGKTATFL